MTNKTYQLETLSCPSCAAKIDAMFKKTEGVNSSEVLFTSSRVKVAFNEALITNEAVKGKIESLGYKVLNEKQGF